MNFALPLCGQRPQSVVLPFGFPVAAIPGGPMPDDQELHAGSVRFRAREERERPGVERWPTGSPLLSVISAGGAPEAPNSGTKRRTESAATRAECRARVWKTACERI